MSLRFLSSVFLLLIAAGQAAAASKSAVLRVCAEPNNLPYSNTSFQGFENRLASIIAGELGRQLEYVWWPERQGFIEGTLEADRCDVVMGVPTDLPSVAATRPYYRSTYVFVARKDRALALKSLTDTRLASFRIGIHVTGNDYAPPAQLLARRGLSANMIGFSLFGSSSDKDENTPSRLIQAVKDGVVDAAVAWGPLAGYFGDSSLEITPVSPTGFMAIPFVFDISAAVRKNDEQLRSSIDEALVRRCNDIQSLLREYRVPLVTEGGPSCESSHRASVASR